MHDSSDTGLRAELQQVRLNQDETLRRLSDCEVQIAVNATRIRVLEDRILQTVSAAEFLPVKWAFYGTIGTTLAAVLTALIAGVLSGTPHGSFR
jgi:hypothetical protein